jgi:hypothetical protein
MPGRFEDYGADSEVCDIMERIVDRFPLLFEGFETDGIRFIRTKANKMNGGKPLKLRNVNYPLEVFVGKPYVVEVFDAVWVKLGAKQKNLAVFHIMCGIPVGGFEPTSKYYAKKVRPDYELYEYEFAASGGVPNWMLNDSARDPMDIEPNEIAVRSDDEDDEDEDPIDDDDIQRIPLTAEDVGNL